MKKYISFFITVVMMVCTLSACGTGSKEASADSTGSKEVSAGNEKLKIVTTIFPEYDWVMNILGDNPAGAEVTMLLENGVDLHSYQPTADDILKISTCDMFIYVGGESDEWVEEALKEAVNKDMAVINLLDALGDSVKEEEVKEGMQEHDHDHDHEEAGEEADHEHEEDEHEHEEDEHEHEEDEHGHEHEEGETEYDEHVWLSLRNAEALVGSICDSLAGIDPENAKNYRSNASAYIEKLNSLDEEYKTAVSSAPNKTILFGDRFPFRYLTDDYGLDYYAAFVGCSAETEASFETITFLAQKVDELGLSAVMTIEGADHRIAETIVQNTQNKNARILTMDSMQGMTSGDVKSGKTYLSVMESNLAVLKEALN